MSEQDCIFCKIVAGELPATIVDQDEHTLAFMDINPATRGHALVIPRRHTLDLLSIDQGELEAVAVAAQRLARSRKGAPGSGRGQRDQLLRSRRLADGVPLPSARDSPLHRRSAEAALDAGARRSRRDSRRGHGNRVWA